MNKEVVGLKSVVMSSRKLIENWLDYYVYKNEIPGLALGVFVEDELVIQKEYGYADLEKREKLNSSHLFRIASHSKLFTATSIMILYNRNQLSLDDRISDILPWFKSENEPERDNIRIRHLLSHASGITRDGDFGHWYKMIFPSKKEFINQFNEDISYYMPNHQIKYSNHAFTLAGLVVEKITGMSYSEFVKNEIFDVLGMADSVVDIDEKNKDRHCRGHGKKFPNKKRAIFDHIPAKIMSSATGLSSNVKDLVKFYSAYFLGNDILLPDYIKREMQTVKAYSDDDYVKYGLGFKISKVNKYVVCGHGGGYPGYITHSGMIQDPKVIVVILTNAVDTSPELLRDGVLNLISKISRFTDKLFDPALEKPDYSKLAGFYSTDWAVGLFGQVGNKLVSMDPEMTNPSESLTIFKDLGDLRFRIPNLFQSYPFDSPGQFMEFDISNPDEPSILHAGERSKRFRFEY